MGFGDALSSGLEALLVVGLLVGGTRVGATLGRQRATSWGVAAGVVATLVVVATLAAMAALAPQPMSTGG